MTETVSFGYEEVAPIEKTQRVGAVFSSVASRYDLMNDAMSAGIDRKSTRLNSSHRNTSRMPSSA